MITLAKLFLGLGTFCLLLTVFSIYQRYMPISMAADLDNQSSMTVNSEILPKELIIPSLNIDLPIFPARLEKGKWDLSSEGVSYLMFSDIPTISTNNIFYGHNWPNLLAKITKLKKGDVIELKYSNQTKKDYIIISLATVNPEDISILSNQSEEQMLTLYTCTGFFDSKRFVAVARLI